VLYDHPELREGGLEVLSRVIRQEGGLLFQAHPFRVRDYIPEPWKTLPVELLDGAEICNLHNNDLENARARLWAQENELLPVAGSDDHTCGAERRGIISPHRLRDEAALAALLRSGDYQLYI